MASVSVVAEYVGQADSTAIYRINLRDVGLSTIRAITLTDDNIASGGSAGASGFDLDFIKFSSSLTSIDGVPAAFDFSAANVVYNPGFLRQWNPDTDQAFWNTSSLFGTDGNVYSPSLSTLDSPDGKDSASFGALSLGEGGQVTFLLSGNGVVPPTDDGSTPMYLYFGDAGGSAGASDRAHVTLSDEAVAPAFLNAVNRTGTGGNDFIALGQGINQHLGSGNDSLDGTGGNDTIFAAGGDDFLFGGLGDDALFGQDGNDKLYGSFGNDVLYGENGNDTIYGSAGKDQLFGGADRDFFVFDTKLNKKTNVDKIWDYNVKQDTMYLDNAIFKVGKGTALNPRKINNDKFTIGNSAADAEDRIIYDKLKGVLYYDVDGIGGKDQVKFATISKKLKLTAADFFIV